MRERKLLVNLLANIPSNIQHHLRRGLVSSITCSIDDFLAHAWEIFQSHPVTDVTLNGKEPEYDSGWWFWWQLPGTGGEQSTLPPQLAGVISGRPYPSHESALLALSSACVAYGRLLAGLPELRD